ncbi:MAG: hypothetical protein Q7S73_00370 [bacterium]|nr:hypothetical protein [bacterium]
MDLFQGFLKKLSKTGKVNPQSAFDLGRDAQSHALYNLLIRKGIISQSELDYQLEQEFTKIADMIDKMPPLPRS